MIAGDFLLGLQRIPVRPEPVMKIQQHRIQDRQLPPCGDESGQTMVEYGFVVLAVALAVIGAYQAFGAGVGSLVTNVTAVW